MVTQPEAPLRSTLPETLGMDVRRLRTWHMEAGLASFHLGMKTKLEEDAARGGALDAFMCAFPVVIRDDKLVHDGGWRSPCATARPAWNSG